MILEKTSKVLEVIRQDSAVKSMWTMTLRSYYRNLRVYFTARKYEHAQSL